MGETTSDDEKENVEKISSNSRNHVEDTSSDIKSEDNMIKLSPFKVESKLTLIESPNKIQKSEVCLSIRGSKDRMETSYNFEDEGMREASSDFEDEAMREAPPNFEDKVIKNEYSQNGGSDDMDRSSDGEDESRLT